MDKDGFIKTLRQIIYLYYENISERQVSQAVKCELIPLLISMFFDTSSHQLTQKSQQSSQYVSSKRKFSLQTIKAQNKQNIKPLLQKVQKFSQKIKRQNVEGNPKPQQIDKIIGTFYLIMNINIITLKRKGNFFQKVHFFTKQKRETVEKALISSFTLQKRQAIKKFYLNFQNQKSRAQGCKIVESVFKKKEKESLIIIKRQTQMKFKERQVKNFVLAKGLQLLLIFQRKRMRKSFVCIKEYNISNNPWINKSIRCLALNSPLNVQNSIWRMRNYKFSSYRTMIFQNILSKLIKKTAFLKIKRPPVLDLQQRSTLFVQSLTAFKQIKDFSYLMDSFVAIQRY